MKKALILSGGGTKASYEAGVISQLFSSGKSFDRVYGTSAGAINAAALAFEGSDYISNFWKTLSSRSQLMATNYICGPSDGGFFTMAPTEKLLNQIIPIAAPIPNVVPTVCATNLSTGGSEFFTYLGDSQAFINGVIASASFPGVFVPRKIGNSYYGDGGIRNNTPLNQAIQDGCTDLTVIMCMPLAFNPIGSYTFPTGTLGSFERIPSLLLRSLDLIEQQVFTDDVFDCIENNSKPDKKTIDLTVYAPGADLGNTFDFNTIHLNQLFRLGMTEKALDLNQFFKENE